MDIPEFDTPPIPAATIVLFRERSAGDAEHLMIRRTAKMAFAAGAMVFPGGRIDPDDHVLAGRGDLLRNAPGDADDTAARIGAIRETLEETGIPVGLLPEPDHATIKAWRGALKSGAAFSELLTGAGTLLDLAELIQLTRWCPRLGEARRFDTRFYVARIDADDDIDVDADEATHFAWLTAGDAIAGAVAGTYEIVFPTIRNLERLAQYPRFDAVAAHIAASPVDTIVPWLTGPDDDGVTWLTIPDGIGYPVTHQPLSEVMHLLRGRSAQSPAQSPAS